MTHISVAKPAVSCTHTHTHIHTHAHTQECGQKLTEVSPRGVHAVFETLRSILHSGKITSRVQYMVEVMFAIRKDKFKVGMEHHTKSFCPTFTVVSLLTPSLSLPPSLPTGAPHSG